MYIEIYCNKIKISSKLPETTGWIPTYLIAIGKSAHAAHDTQHVVVGGIHTHSGRGGCTHCIVRHGQQQSGVINAR